MKKKIVIGLLGTTLDVGSGPSRWSRWRPTVSACQHDDLLIDGFELIYPQRFKSMARTIVSDINSVSPETTVNLVPIDFSNPWDFQEVYGALHDFARAYSFDPDENDYLVHITTGTHVAQICLYLLTESRLIPGKLMQTGPPVAKGRDRVGPGTYSIIDLDLSKYDKLASRFRRETADDLTFLKSGIETQNPEFNSIIEMVDRVATRSKEPQLLTGPTGAGKSQLAKRIYELKKSRRQVSGEMVEVNCATLRGDMAMSTLFGNVKGAFTGAMEDKSGLLDIADGGLLFLDEVGELGTDEQAMLLRALEEKSFLPVGAVREVRSDFQLICGTNRDLAEEVRKGNFREDLLARINLWTFSLPGLTERPEDIEPNIDYELERYEEKSGVHATFNREARAAFLKFSVSTDAHWNANFRDLNAAITRMATLADGGRITKADVKEECRRLSDGWEMTSPVDNNDAGLSGILTPEEISAIDPFDRAQLAYVIKVCQAAGSLSEAGRTLFSVSREKKKTGNDADRLSKYLARYSIDWQVIKSGPIAVNTFSKH